MMIELLKKYFAEQGYWQFATLLKMADIDIDAIIDALIAMRAGMKWEEYNEKYLTGKRYTWLVEFETTDTWVADGFNLDDEDAEEMLHKRLPFAFGEEIGAKVIRRLTEEQIKAADLSVEEREG